MILPLRWRHRPRITLGQIMATVAVSAMPIALVMRLERGNNSAVEFVLAGCFSMVLVFLFEVSFWVLLVPLIPPLARTLGRPSWFTAELPVDPTGVEWLDRGDPPGPFSRPTDGIDWLE